jgi:hypothetical protein
MSKQVLDIEQVKHLHELGLDTSKASAYWHRVVRMYTNEVVTNWFVSFTESIACLGTMKVESIKTFTLQDILDILPKDISREGCTWSASLYIDYENNRIAYGNTDRDGFEIYHEIPICENIIDAAYEMLCWVLTNKYIQEYE